MRKVFEFTEQYGYPLKRCKGREVKKMAEGICDVCNQTCTAASEGTVVDQIVEVVAE
jgi:hypothetical protein